MQLHSPPDTYICGPTVAGGPKEELSLLFTAGFLEEEDGLREVPLCSASPKTLHYTQNQLHNLQCPVQNENRGPLFTND